MTAMLIDTHAHLDFEEFDKDRELIIKRAFDSGVEKIINIGTDLESSKKSIGLAEAHKNIYATISLHPIDVDDEEFDEQAFLKLAHHPKVVAIGETGLDYYHQSDKNKQKEVFKKLVEIAASLQKPIIIHCRDAEEDVSDILKNLVLPKRGGVIHCFGKDYQTAKKFLDLGFLISYTGNITYNSQRTTSIKEMPLEKIMIETDCPFMAPNPFRGQRNEPAYVKYVAEKIAQIKGLSFKEVSQITSKNAIEFFGLE